MTRAAKDYLGDGVYVETDDYGSVTLTTEDGYRTTNTIVLEDVVIEAFKHYLKRTRKGTPS